MYFCKSLMSIIHRLKKAPWIPVQRILLVIVWSLTIRYSENVIEERQPLSPIERDLPSAPTDQYCCKTRRRWALGTHFTAKAGSPWPLEISESNWQGTESSWHQGKLLLPKTTDQDFILELNLKPFLLFLSLTLALAWKDNALICISQAIAKGVTFGIESNLLLQGRRKI